MMIYWTDLSRIKPSAISKYVSELSEVDYSRYQHIKDKQRQLQFLIGRMMIYQYCGTDIKIADNGKPILPDIGFSLSHSHNLVALVVSDTPVGLDIEYMDPTRPYQAVAERLKLTLTDDSYQSFYQQFTQYEADYKCGIKQAKNHSFFNLSNKFALCVSYLNNKEKIKLKEINFKA